MSEEQTPDFSMERKECPICQAVWLNGVHYWATGCKGDEETLSNLVCGQVNKPGCINKKHKKGHVYGDKDTWEKRSRFIHTKMNDAGMDWD